MIKPLIGRHVMTRYGFASAGTYAANNNYPIYQIFVASPQSYTPKRQTKETLHKLRDTNEKNNIKMVIHSGYVINLCHPPDSDKHKKSVRVLINDIKDCNELNAMGVIIHMGRNTHKLKQTVETALENYIKGIKSVMKETKKGRIILETAAGRTNELCSNLFDFARLYKKLAKKYGDRIGICIDTCHIFAAGYPISIKKYSRHMDDFIEDNIGWKNITCVHLNDSKQCVNSRVDNHADIGKGHIDSEGLIEFIRVCTERNIMMILETKCDSEEDRSYDHKKQIEFINKEINKEIKEN